MLAAYCFKQSSRVLSPWVTDGISAWGAAGTVLAGSCLVPPSSLCWCLFARGQLFPTRSGELWQRPRQCVTGRDKMPDLGSPKHSVSSLIAFLA